MRLTARNLLRVALPYGKGFHRGIAVGRIASMRSVNAKERFKMLRAPVSLLVVFCLAITSASSAQILEAPRSLGTPPYLNQPNDVLSIFVWKETTLNGKVLVRPDGRISFPLIQDIQAAGLNPAQLKDKIEDSLKPYIDAPNVTVIVEAIQSYRVFVMGKVGKSGAIIEPKPINVMQAIALAGGLLDFAKSSEIVILRGNGESGDSFRFNYNEMIRSINFGQNMLLRNGDVVVVP